MMQTMETIALGKKFLHWIKAIYTFPRAQIKVNGTLSNIMEIRNGTMQGCPLSPLLFILTFEPLLRAIRSNQDLMGVGVKVGKVENKISAYADYLLFFVSNPEISLPNLLNELQ